MPNISTHMIFDNSSKFSPPPVIESARGTVRVKEGDTITVNKRLYKVEHESTKNKSKDGINLTTQFIYVRPVPGAGVFNDLAKKPCPAN